MQNQKSAIGLDGNITAALGYPIGIIALILIFIEKDNKFVRFHALQSVLFGVAMFVIFFVLWFIVGIMTIAIGSGMLATLFGLLMMLVGLGIFAVILFLAYKAYQGETFKLPVFGDLANKWV